MDEAARLELSQAVRARLSRLIREAREGRDWTISEVSRQSRCERAMVSRIESGELTGSVETLVALAVVLDIDLNELKGPRVDADGRVFVPQDLQSDHGLTSDEDSPLTTPDFPTPVP